MSSSLLTRVQERLRRERLGGPLARAPRAAERQLAAVQDTMASLHAVTDAVTAYQGTHRPQLDRALLPLPRAQTLAIRLPNGAVAHGHLAYDLNGILQLQLTDAQRGPSPYELAPAGVRPSLGAADIEAVRVLHREVEGQYLFSTLAAPLALSRAVRNARRAGLADPSFRAAAARLELSGNSLMQHYRGGTCVSLAAVLAQRIGTQVGIQAHVAGSYQRNIILGRPQPGSPGSTYSAEVSRHLEGISHTDVVVPYFDAGGVTRYLHIACGAGVEPDSVATLDPTDILERALRSPASVIARPQRLAVEATAGPFKLHMRDRSTGAIFGLDLLTGRAYMNAVGAPLGEGPISMSLTEPSHRAIGQLFWGSVQSIFRLDRHAMDDLLFLAEHHRHYRDEVVLDLNPGLVAAASDRERALKLLQLSRVALALLPPATETAAAMAAQWAGQRALDDAAAAVALASMPAPPEELERSVELACSAYQRAAKLFSEALALLPAPTALSRVAP